jgi:phasin family protein
MVLLRRTNESRRQPYKENRMFPMNEQFASIIKNLSPINGQFPGSVQNVFCGNEEFRDAVANGFAAQISSLNSLAVNAFATTEKIVSLNMAAAKALMEESAVATKQLMASATPQEFMSLTAALSEPASAKASAYQRQMIDIISAARAGFVQAIEEQNAQGGRKVYSIGEQFAKNLPAGSENLGAMAQAAISNANAGFEQFNQAGRQVVESMKANLNHAVHQASNAASQAASMRGNARKG